MSTLRQPPANVRLPAPANAFPAPREQPLTYPGPRPSASFLLARSTVLPAPPAGFDELLRTYGGAPLGERAAVLGYGSNPVPGQLVHKLGEDAVVPVLHGWLEGADVVYNLISAKGYAFAELWPEDGVRVAVGVTLLDPEQLETMIASEPSYRLVPSPFQVTLSDGPFPTEHRVFAGHRRQWLPRGMDAPPPVAGLATEGRRRPGWTQRDVLALAVEDLELGELGIRGAEDLAERVRADDGVRWEVIRRVAEAPRSRTPWIDSTHR